MSRAAVHTTLRELSSQISKRDKRVRALKNWENYHYSGYDQALKKRIERSRQEQKAIDDTCAGIEVETSALKTALAALASVIGEGLL